MLNGFHLKKGSRSGEIFFLREPMDPDQPIGVNLSMDGSSEENDDYLVLSAADSVQMSTQQRLAEKRRIRAEKQRERRWKKAVEQGHTPGRGGHPPFLEKKEEEKLVRWIQHKLDLGLNPSSRRVKHRVCS